MLENVIRRDTRGDFETIEARYELLKRGTYLMATDAANLPSTRPGKAPLELALNVSAAYSFAPARRAKYTAAEGRQHNRRVELVISGESIATTTER